MARYYLSKSDSELLLWSINFLALISGSPTTYGLDTADATAYGVKHAAYADTLQVATDPITRTKSAIEAKNQSRANLIEAARLLVSIIQGQANVTDAQKIDLGITVRKPPTPSPVPGQAVMHVTGVNGNFVSCAAHGEGESPRRGKPAGVVAIGVFRHVGETVPADANGWEFAFNTGRSRFEVEFDAALPAGTKVWLTCFFQNGRKESGLAAVPVSTTLGVGVPLSA